MGEIEGRANALDHPRAPAALEPSNVALRQRDVFRCGRNRFRAEPARVGGEPDDLECVRGLEQIQRRENGCLRLGDGLAVHGARTVQHEHHLHRMPRRALQVLGRIQHHGEVPLSFLAVHVGQEVGLDAPSRHLELEDEVPVGNRGLVGELDGCGLRTGAGLVDPVAGLDGFDGYAGVESSTAMLMSCPERSPGRR